MRNDSPYIHYNNRCRVDSQLHLTKRDMLKMTEEETPLQDLMPEVVEHKFKSRPAVFVPEGLVDIAKLYSQRKRPPLDYDNVYFPYRNNDEPEIDRD